MRAPFINLDAEWLASLADTFIADGDQETGLRLMLTAQHMQKLDDALASAGSSDQFAAGVRWAYGQVYGRSNLIDGQPPVPERFRLKEAVAAYKGPITRPLRADPAKHKEEDPRLAALRAGIKL